MQMIGRWFNNYQNRSRLIFWYKWENITSLVALILSQYIHWDRNHRRTQDWVTCGDHQIDLYSLSQVEKNILHCFSQNKAPNIKGTSEALALLFLSLPHSTSVSVSAWTTVSQLHSIQSQQHSLDWRNPHSHRFTSRIIFTLFFLTWWTWLEGLILHQKIKRIDIIWSNTHITNAPAVSDMPRQQLWRFSSIFMETTCQTNSKGQRQFYHKSRL